MIRKLAGKLYIRVGKLYRGGRGQHNGEGTVRQLGGRLFRKIGNLHSDDGSQQGFDADKVWTKDYVATLKSRIDNNNNAQPIVSRANQYLINCSNVLDVGCGWMPYQPDSRYTGVDISPNMLNIARQLHPHIKYIRASGFDLPFENGEFEGVRSSGMLRHMKEWQVALKEMIRVCSKKLVFTHLIGNKNERCGMYQWCTTLKDIEDILQTYPKIHVVREWDKFTSIMFMVKL